LEKAAARIEPTTSSLNPDFPLKQGGWPGQVHQQGLRHPSSAPRGPFRLPEDQHRGLVLREPGGAAMGPGSVRVHL